MLDERKGEGEISQPMSDHDLPDTHICVFIHSLNGLTTARVKGQHPRWRPWDSQHSHLPGQGFTAQRDFLRRGWGIRGSSYLSWGSTDFLDKLMKTKAPEKTDILLKLGTL